MKIYNIIRLAGFIGVWLFLLQSCKDEEQLNSKFEIEGTALQQSLDGNASTVVVQVKTTLPMSDWQVDNEKPYYTDKPDWDAFGAMLPHPVVVL